MTMDNRPYSERDKVAFQLSQELHEIILPLTFDDADLLVDWEGIKEDLYWLRTDCSWYIDEWYKYGKSFVRPIAKVRSLIRIYEIHVKQMGEG